MFKLLLLISTASASFHFKDEVKINKSCFINLREFKCHTYQYMIREGKAGVYKIGPGRTETVPTMCIQNTVKESCIILVKKR
jgi:hypothetical protein